MRRDPQALPPRRGADPDGVEQEPDLYASLRVGAAGYLLKDMAPGQLIEAVLGAGRGEPLVPPSMASRLLRDLVGPERAGDADPLAELSDREREVLALLAQGLRNREIAERLVISESGQDPRGPCSKSSGFATVPRRRFSRRAISVISGPCRDDSLRPP